ncbi:MAG: serine/threonine-protein kinase [Snowella sp.]|nr:serine/threonine-protein kinase [Snowella sp.]
MPNLPVSNAMPNLPDFSQYGYQVIERLNHNLQGGRVTYRAIARATQRPVVIKQFLFANQENCGWQDYQEIENEIEILNSLDHAGIPRYIGQFDSGNGLCSVQEYKNAQPLSQPHSFSPESIKNIALQLLEILVYLQSRVPPIIHRDIKPDNVLIDDNFQVYLVDFGLARIGKGTIALSTRMEGTPGYMSPEQVHKDHLTEASDLYGLGATLIYLVTGIQPSSLISYNNNRIVFRDQIPQFSLPFVNWLENLVKPDPTERYRNAQSALIALEPIDLIRVPEVDLDKSELQFVANKIGETLSQRVTVTNNVADTVLKGQWSVSSHNSDPPHTPDSHAWISFSPQEFEGNRVSFEVIVNTSQLVSDSHYERIIVLSSNASLKEYPLKIKVKTASLNTERQEQKISYGFTFAVFAVTALLSSLLFHFNFIQIILSIYKPEDLLFLISFGCIALQNLICGWSFFKSWRRYDFTDWLDWYHFWTCFGNSIRISCVIGLIGGVVAGLFDYFDHYSGGGVGGITGIVVSVLFHTFAGAFLGIIASAIMGIIAFLLIGLPTYALKVNLEKYIGNTNAGILTIVIGVLTGYIAVLGFSPYLLIALASSGLTLTGLLIYPPLKSRKLKAQARRQESQNLIQP